MATDSPLDAEQRSTGALAVPAQIRTPDQRVRDELLVPVHPLALPEPTQVPDLAHLSKIPSVGLFVERAREANPAFALTPDNAATIVELCQRLDAATFEAGWAAGQAMTEEQAITEALQEA